MAPGLGLEPRLPDPESSVLPLDDPGMLPLLLYLLKRLKPTVGYTLNNYDSPDWP